MGVSGNIILRRKFRSKQHIDYTTSFKPCEVVGDIVVGTGWNSAYSKRRKDKKQGYFSPEIFPSTLSPAHSAGRWISRAR